MQTKPENDDLNKDEVKQQNEEITPEDADKVTGGAIDAFLYFQDPK